jgi:hypothetical protein
MQEGMGEVMLSIIDHYKRAFDVMRVATYFKENTGRWRGYHANPSKSQSSPWACPDLYRKWHPLDALIAERRALREGAERVVEEAKSRDKAWWDEMRRG